MREENLLTHSIGTDIYPYILLALFGYTHAV